MSTHGIEKEKFELGALKNIQFMNPSMDGSQYDSEPSPRINGLSIKQIFETLLIQNIIETNKKCQSGMTPEEILKDSEETVKNSILKYNMSLKHIRNSLTETYWRSFAIMKYAKSVVFYIQFNDMYPKAFELARKIQKIDEDSIMDIGVFKSKDKEVRLKKLNEIQKLLEIGCDLCKMSDKTLEILLAKTN